MMKIPQLVACKKFPCLDVKHDGYIVPDVKIKPENILMMMISEAAPADPADYYYADGNPLYQQTTVQAFNDAGVRVKSVREILDLGVYLTTAVKCGKTGYGIKTATIKECSNLLEKEIALFPNVKVFMLMGDVAIKAVNYIATRAGEGRVIPAGSTYKIRGQKYFFQGKRTFPSYLQAGPSFNIEKSKRRMIAEDIRGAMNIIR
jgi:uracil-DNA glycosylase